LFAVEVYKNETRGIILSFMLRRITFLQCMAGLDAALADLRAIATADEVASLDGFRRDTNRMVMREMERRGANPKKLARHF
jgi:hypothetical protein